MHDCNSLSSLLSLTTFIFQRHLWINIKNFQTGDGDDELVSLDSRESPNISRFKGVSESDTT